MRDLKLLVSAKYGWILLGILWFLALVLAAFLNGLWMNAVGLEPSNGFRHLINGLTGALSYILILRPTWYWRKELIRVRNESSGEEPEDSR